MVKVVIKRGLKFSEYTDILLWVTNNCPSYTTSDGIMYTGVELWYEFFFVEEDDAALFALKWS